MSLTLSPEEVEARRAVALPYELQRVRSRVVPKQWRCAPMSTDLCPPYKLRPLPPQDRGLLAETDARQYLPKAAGGLSATGGHVLYVRDSESELDSDEDPDDELDF